MDKIEEDFLAKSSRPPKNMKRKMAAARRVQRMNVSNHATKQNAMPKANTMSFSEEDEIINEIAAKNKKPIFFVCSYTNTRFGRIYTSTMKVEYTHAALAFDSSLEQLYTFNAGNNLNKFGGFRMESISEYIDIYNDAMIHVSCIFVKPEDFDTIKKEADYIAGHIEDTRYGFLNVVNILMGKAKKYSANMVSLVCSQFCTWILNKAHISIIYKPDNLITPEDIANASDENERVYVLYKGLAREYDKKKIDNLLKKMKVKAELIKEQNIGTSQHQLLYAVTDNTGLNVEKAYLFTSNEKVEA